MKLLIVEDETLTREGLMQSLSWRELGVKSVFCAENGQAGLSIAKKLNPDIVITDIRMPRMDGITMAYRIKDMFPDCRIVFLTAYSEIDYYKAAIELKAVRYLDKPVETAELKLVIQQATAECMEIHRYKSNLKFHKLNERQKLVDAICLGENEALLKREFRRLYPSNPLKSCEMITAFLVNLRLGDEEDIGKEQLDLEEVLGDAVSQRVLYTVRHKNLVVLFLFTSAEPSSIVRNLVCKKLKNVFQEYDFFIAVGKTVRGMGNANRSYETAKATLSKAYYYPLGQEIYYSEAVERDVSISAYTEEKSAISSMLFEKNREAALAACNVLYQKLKNKKDLVYQKAQELYCEIISEVFHLADTLHLQIKEEAVDKEIAWTAQIEYFNLDELHGFLCRHINLLFNAFEKSKSERRPIQAIKVYIAQHYMDDALSVSDISTSIHMSTSYICTIFKKETGVTINSYLTKYRMERAKRYLDETLLPVSEISEKIGYRDNSYFGRIFRKRFGMTPIEYRNRSSK